jgi:O-antigen biosynthesis protein WbqP
MSNKKRVFDICVSLALICISFPLLLIIAALVKKKSVGNIFHYSLRVGRFGQHFRMIKFRTMVPGTPQVATHLLGSPDDYLTPFGAWLRKTSLDELPQLLCVLRGSMSLVGPRPALFNQSDLIRLRKEKGVDALLPGITGWAQINGRDSISVNDKVKLDVYYLENWSVLFDIKIICFTVLKAIRSENVSH